MNVADVRDICKKLECVTEDVKWEDHLCFNVGGKMFVVVSMSGPPYSASFKVPNEEFDSWCGRQGVKPAPYLARYKWVHIDDISRMSKRDWQSAASSSWRLIASKLPAKLRPKKLK